METNNYLLKIKKILVSMVNNTSSKEDIYKELNRLNSSKLTNGIIKIIYDELKYFSFDNDKDLSYIYSALEVLDYLANKTKLKNVIKIFFDNLHNELLKLVTIGSNYDNKNKQYKLLLKILYKLENDITNYTYQDETNHSKNDEAIISYVIFDLKDYSFLDNMLKRCPNLVNTVDKNNNPIIKKVILRYLISLNKYIEDGNRIDLQYYSRIFKRIVMDNSFRISEEERKDYYRLINNYLMKFCHITNNKKKEEIIYYKNKIELGLLGIFDDQEVENLNYEYGITKDFSVPIQSEAKKIYILNRNIKASDNTRRIYTFDHNPNEIDDGISISKKDGLLIAGVHIANPASYLSSSSIIINEARKRTESIYFDNGQEQPICIPMLPPLLSKDLMGLNEGQNIYSINFYYYYDEITGTLVHREVKNEIINVKKNYDYADFDGIIKHGSDESLVEELLNMEKVARFMGRDFDQSTIMGLMDAKAKTARGINVVTNFMISNNINMARMAKEKDVPFIYRNHKLDEGKDKVDNIRKKVLARKPVTSIFKLLDMLDGICSNAKYSSICLGHDTLGTDGYSHTTSPLRRYVDILNIICIEKFIIRNDYTEEDIKRYKEIICKAIEEVNAKRKFIDSYSKEYERRLVKH